MKGSYSSRKLTMKLVATIFRQKGGQVNCYTLYLEGSKNRCLCILLDRHLLMSLFVFTFANDSSHFWYWCGLWVQGSWSLLLTSSYFAWSLQMKHNDLHVQNGDIKEASSIFFHKWVYITFFKNSIPYIHKYRI